MRDFTSNTHSVTIGLDLGDKCSYIYVLTPKGEAVEEGQLRTTRKAFKDRFANMDPCRVVIETGSHSPWVSRLLEELGHEVIVANSRQFRLIFRSHKKSDSVDAESLARVGRFDPKLLEPIQHRSAEAQRHLVVLRAREVLIKARTNLVNYVRGAVKPFGGRITGCTTRTFHKKAQEFVPEELQPVMAEVLKMIGHLNAKIARFDKAIERAGEKHYPETQRLRQIKGVGPLTSLAYVLVISEPQRFKKSRNVGAYLGLVPRKCDSGERQAQLRITKAGNGLLRRLLVGSAQYIMGPFGVDSDLRRHGEAIAKRGGKNAKKRAVVAVARKLAVLLHTLWLSGEDYEPLRNTLREKPSRMNAMAS